MKYEPYERRHDDPDWENQQIVLHYWDLVQVRYHVLRALKVLRGDEDFVLGRRGRTRDAVAIEELEAAHRLNNHLCNEAEFVKEEVE